MIETYIITWNSEAYIHLTINYYKEYSKVIIYDNFSTDKTREVCESLGAEVRMFGQAGVLDDAAYLAVKNNCWKGSKADWVIVVDDDEIFYENQELEWPKEATIIQPQGWGVFSNEMPTIAWIEYYNGVKDDNYSKFCVFNPKEIQAMHYCYGCHEPRPDRWPQPQGNVKIERYGWLLHYRTVGGVERLLERHRQYLAKEWGDKNIRFNLAHHYKQDERETRKWFQENLEKSVPFI